MGRRRGRGGLPYVAHADAAGVAHVMADGSPIASTVLTLSHWPGTPTPPELRADLSAQSAFAYLASRRRWPAASAVTADHFDQDGIVTVFALSDPEAALARRDRLVAVAEAGDFQRGCDRAAARVAMAVAAYADPRRSPVADLLAATPNPSLAGDLHREVLGRLADMVDGPDRYRALWEEEDAFLSAGEAAVARGDVTVEEVADVDLAVVTVARPVTGRATEFGWSADVAVHPMAVHNHTDMTRVLTVAGADYELRFRYETWVRLASHRPAPRVDVAPLAARLNAEEPGDAVWSDTGAGAIVARLVCRGSGLDPVWVRAAVEEHLRAAAGRPPAWNPYR